MTHPLRTVSLLASLLLVSACDPLASQVEVRNESKFAAGNIVVSSGGLLLESKDIAPGQSRTLRFSPREDSSLSIRYRLIGEARDRGCAGDVYVTGLGMERLLVTIRPDGGCRVAYAR